MTTTQDFAYQSLEPAVAEQLIERVVDLATRTPTAFDQAVARSDVAGIDSDLPQRLVELVAARAARCIAVLS